MKTITILVTACALLIGACSESNTTVNTGAPVSVDASETVAEEEPAEETAP